MKICVIGGGAAGCMAAVTAARAGADVILLEKNEKIGKKLYITGKGRCNLTNNCDASDFLKNVVNGEKFLRSAVYSYTPADTMEFFENEGVELVTERGNRVFPASQKSNDIIKALSSALKESGVPIRLNSNVESVKRAGDKFEIKTGDEIVIADKVIIASGGASYPSTGSTGDGYKFAESFKLKVVKPAPALSPIVLNADVSELEGISLKNVSLCAKASSGKPIKDAFGEMLFTKKGISGPVALTISSYICRLDNVTLFLDLKPALDSETLEKRIIRDFTERSNQELKNVTRALLPDRLNLYVLKFAGLDIWKKVNSVTKAERLRLVDTLKGLKLGAVSVSSFDEAVITSGGVDLKELKPDMECKSVDGLYFAGEVIDADALTGGFNLQIAFSTGVKAALSAVGKGL